MNHVYSPSVAGLTGILGPMNPLHNPSFIGPLVMDAPSGVVPIDGSRYVSRATLGGSSLAPLMSVLNLVDTFFG